MILVTSVIIGYVVLFLCCFVSILRRDIFFAVFFLALFVYSVFAIFGYTYVPVLSTFLGLYFGEDAIIPSAIFTAGSLAAIYVFFRLLYMPVVGRVRVAVWRVRPAGVLVVPIYLVLLGLQLWFYAAYASELNYATVSDDEVTAKFGPLFKVAHLGFKFSDFHIVTLYALLVLSVRFRSAERITLGVLLLLHVIIFVIICVQLGTRTDPLKVTLGVCFLELMRRTRVPADDPHNWSGQLLRHIPLKVWGAGVLLLVVATTMLSILARIRNPDAPLPDASVMAQAVLLQDYYAPYHMLLAAVSQHIVDPLAVAASNAANALVFLNVPYLQTYVMEHVAPANTTSRSASPAFYLLTEGFLFAGYYGVIYNGVIVAGGLAVWRLLTLTTNNKLNVLAGALLIEMAADAVRGQSSYFLKSLYLFAFPSILIFGSALGALPIGIIWKSVRRGSGEKVA